MLELERKRRELEDAAKKAKTKDEQHHKEVENLIQVLSDYKEMSEQKDAENRKMTEEFMAEKEKIEREKDKLIEEKDKALKEKDKFFEEYKQAMDEKAEQERRRNEDIRFFEETLRKIQSMMTKHMIKNHDDENVRNLCLEVNDIVDSYEGPDDMRRIEDSMRSLGRTLVFENQE
ncbi:Oidioi.mRNA.OKI2018_I69.chr2.g6932.t1.cds [Oikopleura dioica]|uniref:Oidioi.mRNA.OKI2018_I69.chr2.g6932.t1.cds n=1 Tax=Oikopleura dioica TaxID=34765 RepID=A0ABN7TDS0_OIKDI|nr:Oidioi.mRNA.OKI2018_I69.chr2.g6932.t1.cds [Oikopleura dioica]